MSAQSPNRAIPVIKKGFARQLLYSHLQIAGIGIVVLLIASASTLFLSAKVNSVVQEWGTHRPCCFPGSCRDPAFPCQSAGLGDPW